MESNLLNYLLGVVAGDGCLIKSRRIALESVDLEWMEQLYGLLGRPGKLSEVSPRKENERETRRFYITDRSLVDWFIKHGLRERKSTDELALVVPDLGLERDFLRGLLDSDGNVDLRKGGRRISWYGNKIQMEWVAEVLGSHGIVVRSKKIKAANCWYVYVFGEDASNLSEKLIGKDYFLRRKTELLERIRVFSLGEGNSELERRRRSVKALRGVDWRVVYEEEFLRKGRSCGEIAQGYGCTGVTVSVSMRRVGCDLGGRGGWGSRSERRKRICAI